MLLVVRAWILLAATAIGLTTASTAHARTPASCPDDAGAPIVELGPADAPTTIEAFLDPVDSGSLLAWLELRRLVADLRGSAKVSISFVRGLGPTEPRADEVRAWVVAVARRGHLLPALRLVARDGEDRLYMRLHASEDAEPLAKAPPLDPGAMRCGWQHVLEATRTLTLRQAAGRSVVYRLPVFVIDELTFEDSPTLDRLRWEVAKQAPRLREARDRSAPLVPQPKAASDRMRRPPLRGSLLGGSGLPHRFVLMAGDENNSHLVEFLPLLLEFRRRNPGVLAVHLVARGNSIGGQRLRHRLCAARLLGLDLDYARFLSLNPATRRFPTPTQESLLEQLDAVDEKACAEEPDPAELNLPDGGWLDGIPRSRNELENLDTTLRLLDAASRPLSPVLAPARDEDEL